jgi:hypothetical protein
MPRQRLKVMLRPMNHEGISIGIRCYYSSSLNINDAPRIENSVRCSPTKYMNVYLSNISTGTAPAL